MSQDRRQLGAPEDVPGMRQGGLLRFVKESSCDGALPRGWASHRALDRTGRRLALVLYRRGDGRIKESRNGNCETALSDLSQFSAPFRHGSLVFDQDERDTGDDQGGAQ